MLDSIIQLDSGESFVRHTEEIKPSRPTILFVHGLGESSLSFLEAFTCPEFQEYNLLAPDLLGYGRSSLARDADYSFSAQIKRLYGVLEYFKVSEFHLVGHSLGGDIATHMAASDSGNRIRCLVNIEGNLTSEDLFISEKAVKANNDGRGEVWLREDFTRDEVLGDWGHKRESARRYHLSLKYCQPKAFLDNAIEACEKAVTETVAFFQQIQIPKLYCWGWDSLAPVTQNFLEERKIPNSGFEGASHWVMIDQSQRFYARLAEFYETQVGDS